MKSKILVCVGCVIFAGFAVISCNDDKNQQVATNDQSINKDSLVKRGEYLVNAMGCDDCHSPKKMGPMGPEVDMAVRFSGFPGSRPLPAFDSNFVKKGMVAFNEDFTASCGPWGISYSANLTSDATGAGSWTEENFIRALRKGKFKGIESNRMLLPPMPWQNFAKLTDTDIKAIFAFFQTTKPVQNIVPAAKQFTSL